MYSTIGKASIVPGDAEGFGFGLVVLGLSGIILCIRFGYIIDFIGKHETDLNSFINQSRSKMILWLFS